MFIVFVVRLLILAVKIVPSISMTVVLVSSTIFFMSLTSSEHQSLLRFLSMSCSITSSNLLSLSSLLELGSCCLASLRYRGWGRWVPLYSSCCCWILGKTLLLECSFGSSSKYFCCQNRILPPLFIGFDSNTLPSSLLLLLLHKAIPFQLSIGHVHPYSLSSGPSTTSLFYVFDAS